MGHKKADEMTEEELRQATLEAEKNYKPLADRMQEQGIEVISTGHEYPDSKRPQNNYHPKDDIEFMLDLGFTREEMEEMQKNGEVKDGKYIGIIGR